MADPASDWHKEAMTAMERDDWFIRQENAFLDALAGKAKPLCTIEEAYQTLKVQLAAIESADTQDHWKIV